ncbi:MULTISPECIES: hypothetical protein [unclassified Microcoleus]|uniref:hypothetical protein n=1 Tax=unclassified Microcoleus TaxID=2642155 RepID=UPI001DB364E2|nr:MULTISPECIES: hypothetical protein [unclassified Microcoleus]MCC3418083.1 hypothetical protein [Microcoleus sp. PH2017_07_MST_O_A]MCC3425358.1 hypothetical protein [Microcoleus sp. PH2017_01_SCD_O_A]MCC3442774.1 hypothetical protein [Microcoleus sp. PH2017_03_ELD_O_A]MCC3466934.1 hypothetical protein [Microcoleus sp. PH2017_06_SFM_O_A]MCC3504333.1 hypothetical protein [Microcoleus sp. PH2017_19_SFW_U_A]MCC3508985.1 hypothetical protein [Microcoleus sp. PH2017_17_BER_D_A]
MFEFASFSKADNFSAKSRRICILKFPGDFDIFDRLARTIYIDPNSIDILTCGCWYCKRSGITQTRWKTGFLT